MTPYRLDSWRCIGAKLGIVTALTACAGCIAPQNGDPTGANAPASEAPLAAAEPGTVAVLGTTQAIDGAPLAGVTVCFRPAPTGPDDATCTTSDDDGTWRLDGVPSRTFIAVTFAKDGFVAALCPITTSTIDLTMPSGDGTLVPAT
jgi:hypothetical protein